MRRLMLLVGAVLVAGVAVGVEAIPGSGARREEPTTLVTADSSIYAFAQDGDMLAWTSGKGESCPEVQVRAARGGPIAVVAGTDGGDACYGIDAFALGGKRVVWGGFEECCNHGYGVVETDAPRSKSKTLRSLSQDYHAWGDFLTGAAGDGGTLVYAASEIALSQGKELDGQRGWVHCLPHDPCTWDVTGGGVWRVAGRTQIRVPGAPPTALVAAARGRIALVPVDRRRFPGPCSNQNNVGCPEIRTAEGANVEIRDASTGRLITSFAPRGRVTALGLGADTVAVLVRSGQTARVEWYWSRSGDRVGATSVASTVADTIDLSGHVVVVRRGRTILGLNTADGRIRVLTQANSTPVGLSIEGTRVAWAEGKQIRSLNLR